MPNLSLARWKNERKELWTKKGNEGLVTFYGFGHRRKIPYERRCVVSCGGQMTWRVWRPGERVDACVVTCQLCCGQRRHADIQYDGLWAVHRYGSQIVIILCGVCVREVEQHRINTQVERLVVSRDVISKPDAALNEQKWGGGGLPGGSSIVAKGKTFQGSRRWL